MMEEQWRDVPEYEGLYQVSNQGRVRSLDRVIHKKDATSFFQKGIILKPRLNNGYLKCNLYKNSTSQTCPVHKLVAMAFLNHKPDGFNLVVDHINNIPTDNRLENLQIVSHRYNISKDKKGGTSSHQGVSWKSENKKWSSRIRIGRREIHLGYFTDEYEAAIAYQKALAKLENEKNKPTEQQ